MHLSLSNPLYAYQGRWYEIARTPVPFEQGCDEATADYIFYSNRMWVINTCYADNQPIRQSIGIATPTSDPQILEVKFIYQLNFEQNQAGFEVTPSGIYEILYTDYEHFAIVNSPIGWWILSRKPELTSAEQNFLQDKARELGKDPAELNWN